MVSVKTDNHDPGAKLDLRRYMLRRYHADSRPAVLDCCQGDGLLWQTLRSEFPLSSYWGIDVKPKKGRLKIASERILAQPGWKADVVDIDTYGSPWKHWAALLPNLPGPLTVFLTIGQIKIQGSPLLRVAKEALGIKELNIPNAIGAKLNEFAISHLLTMGYDSDTILVEAVEAVSSGNARYLGVRLEPGVTR